MCYDTLTLTKRSLDYARRVGYDDETIKDLEEQFRKLKEAHEPLFHVSGFQHPTLPVITDIHQPQLKTFLWGLVPFWVKDKKQAEATWNKTLNARGETIFEKPAFRAAAKSRRCLVVVDGFYEHHHFKGKTYPYLIQHRQKEPLLLGGIFELWTNPEDEKTWQTVSIVTTSGNKLLTKIHNNPKMSGPRMPLILPKGVEEKWLQEVDEKADKDLVQSLINPYPENELEAYTVGKLRGKEAVGNKAEVLEEVKYPELQDDQKELF